MSLRFPVRSKYYYFLTPTAIARCRGGQERTHNVWELLARHDARREDRFEMFGAIAIDVHQVFVGDAT